MHFLCVLPLTLKQPAFDYSRPTTYWRIRERIVRVSVGSAIGNNRPLCEEELDTVYLKIDIGLKCGLRCHCSISISFAEMTPRPYVPSSRS